MSENPIAHKPITIDYPDVIMTAIDELAPSVAEILGDSVLTLDGRLFDFSMAIHRLFKPYKNIGISLYPIMTF